MVTTLRYRSFVSLAAALSLLSSLGLGAVAGARKASTQTVAIDGTAFVPATLTVKVGDSITWVNRDPFPHTVTSKAGRFDSHNIAPDASWTFNAVRRGAFPYICTLHPTMKGTLRVE